ncbi:MAG: MFS transporter, partial [Chloroflexota bacterium]|nr:MFS transporter [Chloroflexota bacterium]
IGTLIGIGGFISVVVAFPSGMVSDGLGRKFALVPGLALLAVSAYLLSLGDNYTMLLIMVSVYGVAWGISQGTAQTYAMDLAPAQQRGTFLGVWSLFQAAGGFVSPLVVGGLAEWWDFGNTFVAVAAWLAVSALLIMLFAPETRWRAVAKGS